jgi:diguanylate cyclase (GGDEF)-like protein
MAPITVDGEPWGFILARESWAGTTDELGLRMLEFCASLAAGLAQHELITQQKVVIADQEWQLQGQRELLQVAELMLVSTDPTSLLQEIVDRIGSVIDVDTIDIALHFPDQHVLRTIVAKGAHADVLSHNAEIADDQGIMGWVVQHRIAERIDFASEDARLVRWAQFGRKEGSLIAVPLMDRSSVVGVMVLMRFSSNVAFSEREFALIKNFSDLASIALRNAVVQHSAEARARTDPMTGLGNRATIERTIEGLIESQDPFSVMVIDLDHFKLINDAHGHLAGDKVLVRVAAAIRAEARGGDTAFRLGGDEFLLVLPSTAADGALAAAGRLLEAIKDEATSALSAYDIAITVPVTCSIGIACFPANGPTLTELISSADGAAYEAKRDGRNRARLAKPEPGSE